MKRDTFIKQLSIGGVDWFQQTEYIQSPEGGNSWLEIPYNLSNSCGLKMAFQRNRAGTNDVFGYYVGGTARFIIRVLPYNGFTLYRSLDATPAYVSSNYNGINIVEQNYLGSGLYKYSRPDEGELTNLPVGTWTIENNKSYYRLFATCNNTAWTTQVAFGTTNIYYLQLTDGEDIVQNLIPGYTTKEGVKDELGNIVPIGTKGTLDTLTNVLYVNRGTGNDFIAGPDI